MGLQYHFLQKSLKLHAHTGSIQRNILINLKPGQNVIVSNCQEIPILAAIIITLA